MRTVELPDEVYERASRAAAARGLSVVEYLGRRVQEDAPLDPSKPMGKRVEFPVFDSKAPGSLRDTKEILDQLELEDALRRGGFSD